MFFLKTKYETFQQEKDEVAASKILHLYIYPIQCRLIEILKENCCVVQITDMFVVCVASAKVKLYYPSLLAARAELHIQHNKVSYRLIYCLILAISSA